MKETEENGRLAQTKEASTQKKQTKPSKRVVLIGRAKGQSWEDFENYCVEVFHKSGFIQEEQ